MNEFLSKHEVLMHQALSLFPEQLEGKFLDLNDFRKHFTDFYGRPVEDVAEALRIYSHNKLFKTETKLDIEYLDREKGLGKITAALEQLRTGDLDKFHGLGEPVYAKAIAGLPLNISEVRNLPDEVRSYLVFTLWDIDRPRLRKELLIHGDSALGRASKLEKTKATAPVTRVGRVFMDGRNINIMVLNDRIYTIAKLQQGGSHYNFMRYLTDPDNFEFVISHEEISKIEGCEHIKDLGEHIRHCGFDSSLKEAFFTRNKDRLHFWPTANLNNLQCGAVKKQALKIEDKS